MSLVGFKIGSKMGKKSMKKGVLGSSDDALVAPWLPRGVWEASGHPFSSIFDGLGVVCL